MEQLRDTNTGINRGELIKIIEEEMEKFVRGSSLPRVYHEFIRERIYENLIRKYFPDDSQ